MEGLHLGQDDYAIAAAREIVRRECWIGKSTHSLDQAVASAKRKVRTISASVRFLPLRPSLIISPSALEDIRRVHELVRLPIFCIGGIKLSNLPTVLAAGAKRVVIVSGLLQSADIAVDNPCRQKPARAGRKLRYLKSPMSVLVVGSIALDTVKTPVEEHADQLGGSASYAAVGASFFAPGQSGRRRRRGFSRIGIRILEESPH